MTKLSAKVPTWKGRWGIGSPDSYRRRKARKGSKTRSYKMGERGSPCGRPCAVRKGMPTNPLAVIEVFNPEDFFSRYHHFAWLALEVFLSIFSAHSVSPSFPTYYTLFPRLP